MERRARGSGSRSQEGNFFTPGASPLRRAIEGRSAPLLLRMRQAPRWLIPVVPLALLLIGLAAPVVIGGVGLLALVALLGWLAYLSWPTLGDAGRLLRVVALVLLASLCVFRLLGTF